MYKNDYEQWYKEVREFFLKGKRLTILKALYRVLPVIVGIAYIIVLGMQTMLAMDSGDYSVLARIVLVPLVGFIFITIIRKSLDYERPYEKYKIEPLIKKNKKGQSLPSRHAFSASIIALAVMYVNFPLGAVLFLVCLVICVIRVLAGVHFARDVFVAVALSLFLWLIFFVPV